MTVSTPRRSAYYRDNHPGSNIILKFEDIQIIISKASATNCSSENNHLIQLNLYSAMGCSVLWNVTAWFNAVPLLQSKVSYEDVARNVVLPCISDSALK